MSASFAFGPAFVEVLARVRERQASGSPLWFRGHADSGWPLLAGLQRFVTRVETEASRRLTVDLAARAMRAEYQERFQTFIQDAWPFLSSDERTDWGAVMAMQHYRHHTRLLDWTESFACALHFAQMRQPDQTAAVIMVDPVAFNTKSVGVEGFIAMRDDAFYDDEGFPLHTWHPTSSAKQPELRSVAVSPRMVTPRMAAQKARFIMCGDDRRPLEEIHEGVFETIVLPPDTFQDAEAFLKVAGVDELTLFPDHEGLYLKRSRQSASLLKQIRAEYGKR